MTLNRPAVFALIFIVIGFITGFVANSMIRPNLPTADITAMAHVKPLRLEGYTYISPLLACDTVNPENAPELEPLKHQLTQLIGDQQNQHNLDVASVYIRNFQNGANLTIHDQEKYSPASLVKIPLLVALYKYSQTHPQFLAQSFTYKATEDYNTTQEIPPAQALINGQAYTNEEAIRKMILYSDNNAYTALMADLPLADYLSTYKDLHIPTDTDPMDQDVITVENFAYFFRTLYNATYLYKSLSEKALQLLTAVDYKNGLAAGVPQNIQIAHKYGLRSFTDPTGVVTQRELHDCGIVYEPSRPYLICVMTKSHAPLATIESVIKNISSITYQQITNL